MTCSKMSNTQLECITSQFKFHLTLDGTTVTGEVVGDSDLNFTGTLIGDNLMTFEFRGHPVQWKKQELGNQNIVI